MKLDYFLDNVKSRSLEKVTYGIKAIKLKKPERR